MATPMLGSSIQLITSTECSSDLKCVCTSITPSVPIVETMEESGLLVVLLTDLKDTSAIVKGIKVALEDVCKTLVGVSVEDCAPLVRPCYYISDADQVDVVINPGSYVKLLGQFGKMNWERQWLDIFEEPNLRPTIMLGIFEDKPVCNPLFYGMKQLNKCFQQAVCGFSTGKCRRGIEEGCYGGHVCALYTYESSVTDCAATMKILFESIKAGAIIYNNQLKFHDKEVASCTKCSTGHCVPVPKNYVFSPSIAEAVYKKYDNTLIVNDCKVPFPVVGEVLSAMMDLPNDKPIQIRKRKINDGEEASSSKQLKLSDAAIIEDNTLFHQHLKTKMKYHAENLGFKDVEYGFGLFQQLRNISDPVDAIFEFLQVLHTKKHDNDKFVLDTYKYSDLSFKEHTDHFFRTLDMEYQNDDRKMDFTAICLEMEKILCPAIFKECMDAFGSFIDFSLLRQLFQQYVGGSKINKIRTFIHVAGVLKKLPLPAIKLMIDSCQDEGFDWTETRETVLTDENIYLKSCLEEYNKKLKTIAKKEIQSFGERLGFMDVNKLQKEFFEHHSYLGTPVACPDFISLLRIQALQNERSVLLNYGKKETSEFIVDALLGCRPKLDFEDKRDFIIPSLVQLIKDVEPFCKDLPFLKEVTRNIAEEPKWDRVLECVRQMGGGSANQKFDLLAILSVVVDHGHLDEALGIGHSLRSDAAYKPNPEDIKAKMIKCAQIMNKCLCDNPEKDHVENQINYCYVQRVSTMSSLFR